MFIAVTVLLVFLVLRKKRKNSNDVEEQGLIEKVGIDDMVPQMKMMLKYFSGSLNALERIRDYPNPVEGNIIFKNLQQTIDIHGSVSLQTWFSQFDKDRDAWDTVTYSEKAKQLLSYLLRCGLKKRDEDNCVWNKQSELSYSILGKLEYGQSFEVIDPCWEFEGKVFEKGLVKIV